MPQPIAYNSGNPISGSIEKSTLSFTVEGAPRDERDYSSSYAGVDWYSTIPPQDGKYVIISASNPPMIWVTANETDAELLTTINGLPDRYNQTLFTDTGSALDYLAQNEYFVSRKTPEQIDADSMVLNLDAGIESAYPRTGNDWYDLSGYGYDGTLINGPTFSNGTIVFDGVDDYVTLGTNVLQTDPTGSFTRIAWFNMTEDSPNSFNNVLWHKRTIIGINQNTGVVPGLDGEIYTYIGAAYTGTGVVRTLNTWYQVTVTYDNTSTSIYVNGDLKNTSTRTLESQSGVNFNIALAGSGNYFPGNISTVLGYNRALDATEVLQNYYGGPIVTDGLVWAVDASNLVSYESGSGTTYALTGSRNGTLTNGVSYSSDNGGTFEFDGVDDYITFGSADQILSDTYFTIECWMKSSDNGSGAGSYATFVGTRVGRNASLTRDGGGTRAMFLFDTVAEGNINLRGTSNVFDEQWHHIVGTFDDGLGKIYVDGEFENSASSTAPLDLNTAAFGMGADPNNLTRTFYGQVPIGRVYNKALTDEEVKQNYYAQKQKYQF